MRHVRHWLQGVQLQRGRAILATTKCGFIRHWCGCVQLCVSARPVLRGLAHLDSMTSSRPTMEPIERLNLWWVGDESRSRPGDGITPRARPEPTEPSYDDLMLEPLSLGRLGQAGQSDRLSRPVR